MEKSFFLISAIFVSACDGSILDAIPDPDPELDIDLTAPAVSFAPPALTVESGMTAISTLTAADDVGVTVGPDVTCSNGGSFDVTNNIFTAAIVTTNTQSVCTATASDAAGNAGTATLTVTITPPPDTTAPSLSFSPITLSVESGMSSESTLSVSDDIGVVSGPDVTCSNGGSFNVASNIFTAAIVSTNTQSLCMATATDAAGNEGTATLTVTMTASPISQALTCPRTLPPVSSGTCDISIGSGRATLIQGDVLVAEGLMTNAEALIDNETIVCTGCDCSDDTRFDTATLLTCTDAVVSPGLINGRVSSTFSYNPPFNNIDKYQQRHDWRTGERGNNPLNTSFGGGNRVEWEEIRSVMAGVTSMIGSGSADGMIRNLDRNNALTSALRTVTDVETFPLDDADGTQLASGCNYGQLESETPDTPAVWTIAEGIDAEARNEFLCLSGEGQESVDILEAPIAIVSGAGLTQDDIVNTVSRGTRLVWPPRSETSLYGNTSMVPAYKAAGAKIGLGTNFISSGSANMIRELSCAAEWSDRWGGVFSDEELVDLATINVAQIAGLGGVIGDIAVDRIADITIWNTDNNDGLRTIIDGENRDVALVMRGGVPLYGEDDIIQSLSPADNCEQIDVSSPHFMYHFDLESLGRAVAYSGTDAALYGYIL